MPKAYSLIELLVVITILAVIAGLSIPIITNNTTDNLLNDLKLLEQTLNRLTQEAISSNACKYLYLDPLNNCYFFKKQQKTHNFYLHNGIFFGFLPAVKGPPSNPVRPIKSYSTFDLQDKYSIITLFPDGSCTSGSVYLIAPKNNKMGALTCSVSQVLWNRRYLYHNSIWTLLGDQDDKKEVNNIYYNNLA